MHKKVANTPENVAAFVACFQQSPVPSLITNLHTQVRDINISGHHFPITINAGGPAGNCYICSPTTGYLDYARDETRHFSSSWVLQSALNGLINCCAPIVKLARLDHIVHLNNWLFSTNPVPEITAEMAQDIAHNLPAQFPDKAIAIRSLNTIADKAAIQALSAAGFRMLAARQIYIFTDHNRKPSADMKRDRALLRKTTLTHVGNDAFHDRDYDRAAALYAMLYLQKYTALNPQYTALYLRQMHQRGLLRLAGLRGADGVLVGVTGLFANGQTLTQPLVGYDTTRPQHEGLYRMLMAIAQDYAQTHGLFFNMSAGAPKFKRLRRATPCIEYTAIYDRHLAWPRRFAIGCMARVLARVGVPLLQRFEL